MYVIGSYIYLTHNVLRRESPVIVLGIVPANAWGGSKNTLQNMHISSRLSDARSRGLHLFHFVIVVAYNGGLEAADGSCAPRMV